MVKVRYLGLANPAAGVDQLRPAGRLLSDWRLKFKPQGPEYLAICEAIAALDKVGLAVAGEKVAADYCGFATGGGQNTED